MDTTLDIGKDTVPRGKHILTQIWEPTSQLPFIDDRVKQCLAPADVTMLIVLFKIIFFSAFVVCCHCLVHCTVLHCAVVKAATSFSTACCCLLLLADCYFCLYYLGCCCGHCYCSVHCSPHHHCYCCCCLIATL